MGNSGRNDETSTGSHPGGDRTRDLHASPRDPLQPPALGSLLPNLQPLNWARMHAGAPIGRGGMGTVLAVVDDALRRRVALKVLDERHASDETVLEFFVREMQITAQLSHPAIVPVHDVGETADGKLAFTMQLIEGRTLSALIAGLPPGPRGRHAQIELLEIIVRVCDALAFAHSRGVIHCDMKPSNVMVGEHGQVYVLDWGLARTSETRMARESEAPRITVGTSAIDSTQAFGSPAYMAPEQASGLPLDERTDVFAVGCLLYEAFSGRAPYEAETGEAAVALAREAKAPPLSQVAERGSVPAVLDRIVSRAMAREPERRHETVAELRAEIQALLRGGWGSNIHRVAAGETVVREGDRSREAYVILSGRLEARRDIGGTSTFLREMAVGDVFGELAILTDSPRTASVIAIEDSSVLMLDETLLEREFEGLTPWLAAMLRALAQRMRSMEEAAGSREGPSAGS